MTKTTRLGHAAVIVDNRFASVQGREVSNWCGKDKAFERTLGLPWSVYGKLVSLLITIPVYGQHEYTHALVGDLDREGAEYLIVDNRGDYPKVSNERIITPGENLGWAGGSDLGFRVAFSEGYSHAMTLNNDTRISKGFVGALLDPRLPADAGIVGPMIDDGFRCAVADEKPEAANYTPRPQYRAVSAVEGTALMLSRKCWRTVGGLDLRTFGRYGWGIDLDLALRARKAGYGVYTTEMAYINHFGGKTANSHFGSWRYLWGGTFSRVWGLRKVHGWSATLAIEPVMQRGDGPKWHVRLPLNYTTHRLEG